MSRAFVNEDNAAADAEQPIERLVSEQTNYVTARGLELLQEQVSNLQAQHSAQSALGDDADKQRLADLERDLRYFNQRPAQRARWSLRPPRPRKYRLAVGSRLQMKTTTASACIWSVRIRPMPPTGLSTGARHWAAP